jgi:hypothetical protein
MDTALPTCEASRLNEAKAHLWVATKPPWSKGGRPVFVQKVGREGRVLDDQAGMTKALDLLGWTRKDLARATGKSPRTIDEYFRSTPRWRVPAEVLLVLRTALEAMP